MRTPWFRPVALVLLTLSVAACGNDPLTPLPVQAASARPVVVPSGSPPGIPSASTATGTSPPTVRAPATPKASKSRTPKPKPPSESACFGAIQYDLDVPTTVFELQKSMCFHTGGILRLMNIGPGLVQAEPQSVVSGSYEAGIVTLRFIRAGTATVTVPQEDQLHTITVVVRS
jgi:hypothetical protein